jgi:predicted amino acid racemase
MDFLETTIERNPKLIDAAFSLHRDGKIPCDTYLVDLDTVRQNARLISEASSKVGIKNYYMTKQFGRNPLICKTIVNAGIDGAVAINLDETKSLHRNGFKVDHVGHLIQIPTGDIDYVVGKVKPEIITVYSYEKAKQIDRAAEKFGVVQKLMLRPISSSDSFAPNAEGGTHVRDIVSEVKRLSELKNVRVAGLTSFPSFRFDLKLRKIVKTSNFESMMVAKKLIELETSVELEQINAPGSSSVEGMKILADEGATHAEPGHAFTGSTPWHAFEDLPERPAWVYVTEVSHSNADRAYSFSGGLPQSGYHGFFTMRYHQAFLYALAERGGVYKKVLAEPPPLTMDSQAWPDYYTVLHQPVEFSLEMGNTILFGFRPQIYMSRSKVTIVKGIGTSNMTVLGTFDRNGNLLDPDDEGPVGKEVLGSLISSIRSNRICSELAQNFIP